MRVLHKSSHFRGFMFFSVLMLASTLAPSASTGPQPEVACPSCDDFDFCTSDSCDTATGTCRHVPPNCDDGNPCTADFCGALDVSTFGCGHTNLPDGALCDDRNSCTASDACLLGGGIFSQCTGQIQPAGTECSDGNSCTSSDSCYDGGQCVGTPAFPGSSCDDQSLCTSGDTCIASGGVLVCQGTPTSCADSNPCTQDVCDPTTGACGHPPINCDDGNSCTTDSCDPATGSCLRANAPGSCTSGNRCLTGMSCSGGNCLGGTAVNCSDTISCTVDSCQPRTGCVHIPQDSLCGFNNACSFWQCRIPGGCFNLAQQGPQECDGNICTNDSCINYGCVTLSANTNPCNDNNPCTNNDRCTVTSHGAECVGTAFCDDGNVCTADTCNASTLECSYTNRTGSCNDGNPCNGVDTCVSGTCQSGTATCDDGKSCTTDACTQFGCTHTAEGCDDGNPCTFDGCDATEACYHLDQPVSCDDGNPCTSTDTCNAGVCSGTPLNCNDGNACTADSCTGTGCAHQPVTGGQVTCGVGACQRTVDACVNGVPQTCVPGTPSPEACNGLDDDCDGSVDEGCALTVSCVPNPATLSLSSQGGMILINCQFPISGSAATQVYVSRLDSADTSSDDVVLPDPSTLPCPDPVLGTLYERGISENMAIRGVLDPSVAFKFNLPSDGDCSTLDGNRQDFAARLAAIPNNTNATVCISGTLDGQNFEACMLMKVLNTGPR